MSTRSRSVRKQQSDDNVLLSGYCRGVELDMFIIIPDIIQHMIGLYISRYIIYGIGLQRHGEFSLQHRTPVKAYVILEDFGQILGNLNSLYCNHTSIMMRNTQNQVFVAGNNANKRLGINTEDQYITTLRKLDDLVDAKSNKVVLCSIGLCNDHHTYVYTANHKLYCSGDIYDNTSDYKVLNECKFSFLTKTSQSIISIKCGWYHCIMLTDEGNVYSYGNNSRGRCGQNKEIKTTQDQAIMVNVPNQYKIVEVACGSSHNLMLTRNGNVVVFGYNYFGQLGLKGHNLNSNASSTSTSDLNLSSIFEPMINGFFNENNIKVVKVDCGRLHSLCLDSNGQCYTFGYNNFGNLGKGDKLSSVRNSGTVHDGPYHVTMFNNDNTYVNDGCCGGNHNVLLTDRNKIITFGKNDNSESSVTVDGDILSPHVWSKKKELGIQENSFVEKVLAMLNETIVIVNDYKKLTLN